jgi:hypothetical protein
MFTFPDTSNFIKNQQKKLQSNFKPETLLPEAEQKTSTNSRDLEMLLCKRFFPS